MKRPLVLILVLLGLPALALAAPGEPIIERLTDGGAALSLGFGVAPLRPPLTLPLPPGGTTVESGRPLDLDTPPRAMSFDLKLRWPGSDATGTSLEPYVAIAPALFVVEPDYMSRLLGTHVDPTLRVGAKAGVGVDWRLGKDLTLFGAYEATAATPGAIVPGARSAADSRVNGFDFTYGLRLRY
ncbi:MAG TPA: hypothetical protein VFL90_12020 [Methylomirabilota bacterium]|nr:hypothetical protein [Methylomirabilota bacterium]